MDRVIRNLVDNGIKYTPAGGSVRVQLVIRGRETIEIRVVDTGIGIPLEHQPRVFDRFYRVDSSHTVPGTGLGLSIVKEIVKAHGGKIHLESASSGGSIFIVTLPGVERERPVKDFK
jgi:signal transduction histidine kinase